MKKAVFYYFLLVVEVCTKSFPTPCMQYFTKLLHILHSQFSIAKPVMHICICIFLHLYTYIAYYQFSYIHCNRDLAMSIVWQNLRESYKGHMFLYNCGALYQSQSYECGYQYCAARNEYHIPRISVLNNHKLTYIGPQLICIGLGLCDFRNLLEINRIKFMRLWKLTGNKLFTCYSFISQQMINSYLSKHFSMHCVANMIYRVSESK